MQRIHGALAFASLIALGAVASKAGLTPPWAEAGEGPALDAAKVLGPQKETGCGDCHANEYAAWHETKHAKAYDALHKDPKAKEIADKLGVKRIRRSDVLCAECHYTSVVKDGKPEVIAGTSCESCHAAGKDWAKVHGNKEDPDRIAKSEKLGMTPTRHVYAAVSACFRCHVVGEEKLVNTGGHPLGEGFEAVAYFTGEVRHLFIHGEGKRNAEPSPEHRRVFYVAGRLAELEASLRALAKATAPGAFADGTAKRVRSALENVRAIDKAAAGALALKKAIDAVPEDKLAPGNADALLKAAAEVASTGSDLSDADGAKLAAVDALLPAAGSTKGTAWQP